MKQARQNGKTVLITGGTGLIGRHLSKTLVNRGYRVIIFSRSKSRPGNPFIVKWDPSANIIDSKSVAEADIIIHLAGATIGKRWTRATKRSIVQSRVNTCRLLYDTVIGNKKKPELFISASGISYYGVVTTNKIFSETDGPGGDFLANTCRQWEQAAALFESAGVRTVIFRNGLVLASDGGFISRLKLPFTLGLGSLLGKGDQYVPWIHVNDLIAMHFYAIENRIIRGVYNAVAPEHVNFRNFASALAASLNRKIWLPPVPGILLRLALGEMSEIILNGSRVSSEKIRKHGFTFAYPNLIPALEDVVGIRR